MNYKQSWDQPPLLTSKQAAEERELKADSHLEEVDVFPALASEPVPITAPVDVSSLDSGHWEVLAYRLDIQANAQSWAAQDEAEIRRRAVTAARDVDAGALWSLLEANLILNGLTGAKVSPHTLRAYRKGLMTFLEFAAAAGVQLLRPRPNHGAAYARWLEGQGYSTSTVRVRLAAARKLFAALRWAGATRDDPFADTRPQKDKVRPHDKRQPYSEADLAVLLQGASLEMQVLLHLGASAGLRASEITGLTWGHLDLEQGTATITGKGRKTRKVLLSGSLLRALQALGPGGGEQRVIGRTPEAARLRLRTLCKTASVPYLGLHALRHAAGTRLIRAGFQLQDVAEHLGHSDVQTARTYAKWADERLREHLRHS